MINIDVIIPVHYFDDNVKNMLDASYDSVKVAEKQYSLGEVYTYVVAPAAIISDSSFGLSKWASVNDVRLVGNDGETDFCSQVNRAVDDCESAFFSILEMDDMYKPNWFRNFSEYYVCNDSMSVFLPINAQYSVDNGQWSFGNEFGLDLEHTTTECTKDKRVVPIEQGYAVDGPDLFGVRLTVQAEGSRHLAEFCRYGLFCHRIGQELERIEHEKYPVLEENNTNTTNNE